MNQHRLKFAELVRLNRKKKQITQVELGKLVGLTGYSISKIESTRQNVLLDKAIEIAHRLGFSISEVEPGQGEAQC